MNNNRWSIYIDIEGFGALYGKEGEILDALNDLMEAIYLIGLKFYPDTSNRLFSHQTGDGFIIVSEFPADSLEMPIAISITLLRHVSKSGRFAKACISEGDMTDIRGWYPECIRDALSDNEATLPMGGGLMTICPVMGTALINAISVCKLTPSGALLSIEGINSKRIPKDCLVQIIDGKNLVSVDWVNTSLPMVEKIQQKCGLKKPSLEEITDIFANYFRTTEVNEEWKKNSNKYLSLGLC